MRKYIALVTTVLFFGLCPSLPAQNLPAQVAKGLVKSGAGSAASQVTLGAVEAAVTGQVARAAVANSVTANIPQAALQGVCASVPATVRIVASPTLSGPVRIGGVAVPALPDFSIKESSFFKQAKVFLSKHERFAGDPATDTALERLRAAEEGPQLLEIAKLDLVYPKLKKLSVNGMFAKFKYIGPEPSGVPVVLAENFTLMLEGPVKLPLIEEILNVHAAAVVEKQHVGNLSAQVLWVRSGTAEDLKSVIEDIIGHMKAQGFDLRLGVHEVTDFARTSKVHLHFEGFDEKGIFYNYILHVDLANIRLPYNPLTYDKNLTIHKALKEADSVAAYGYEKLAEAQTLILTTVTDILPIAEGSDAYTRLLNTVMM